MTTRIIVVLLGILSFAGLATAQEARRFPQDHVSVEDWNTYLAEVKAMPNVTVRESEQQTTIAHKLDQEIICE
jgi:Tfp pilus assembly protein PilN